MPEPQSFQLEIVHADGRVEKKNVVTHGGPADERWLEEHFRTGHHPDARSIKATRATADLSAEAAAVARQHGQGKLADHIEQKTAPPDGVLSGTPRPATSPAPAPPAK